MVDQGRWAVDVLGLPVGGGIGPADLPIGPWVQHEPVAVSSRQALALDAPEPVADWLHIEPIAVSPRQLQGHGPATRRPHREPSPVRFDCIRANFHAWLLVATRISGPGRNRDHGPWISHPHARVNPCSPRNPQFFPCGECGQYAMRSTGSIHTSPWGAKRDPSGKGLAFCVMRPSRFPRRPRKGLPGKNRRNSHSAPFKGRQILMQDRPATFSSGTQTGRAMPFLVARERQLASFSGIPLRPPPCFQRVMSCDGSAENRGWLGPMRDQDALFQTRLCPLLRAW